VGGWKALAGTDVTVCNVSTDLSGDLVVERHAFVLVALDIAHDDNHSVIIVSGTSTALKERPAPDLAEHELVVREARRRQRRRWLGISAAVMTASALAVTTIALTGGRSATKVPVARPAQIHKVTPIGRADFTGVIRGTLETCGPGPSPAVILHENSGRVIATAVWHPTASSNPGGASKRTLHFSFSAPPGLYYLTMNNEYQMPPQARQIDLTAGRTFKTEIVACT